MNTMLLHTCLICLGSNHCPAVNMNKAFKALTRLFHDIRWSPLIVSPAIGTDRPVPPYHNCVAIFTTTMSASAMKSIFKDIERACGRTPASKSTGLVPLDIDLLQYDDIILKPEDMQAPYVRKALENLSKSYS